jgi:hypothetical protein
LIWIKRSFSGSSHQIRTQLRKRAFRTYWFGPATQRSFDMRQACSRSLVAVLLLLAGLIAPARADDQTASVRIQEEIWALPIPVPMFAYLVRPVGDGPFPLAIMNHGVSLDPVQRSSFRWSSSGMPPCGSLDAGIL